MAPMKTLFAVLLLACSSFAAFAQEQAFTNRATELKDTASADAKTVASLPENTAVNVLARQGAWTRVDASGKQGWVRVFHLRFQAKVEAASSSSGSSFAALGTALGIGRSDKKANLATTGIRGLSPEDLKNASPNPEALAKAETYRADKPSAERFAREGKLSTVPVDYDGGRK
jgi:hypothetical protein